MSSLSTRELKQDAPAVVIWAGLSYLPTGRYLTDYIVRVSGTDQAATSDIHEARAFARGEADRLGVVAIEEGILL